MYIAGYVVLALIAGIRVGVIVINWMTAPKEREEVMEKLALFFILLGLAVSALACLGALWFRHQNKQAKSYSTIRRQEAEVRSDNEDPRGH